MKKHTTTLKTREDAEVLLGELHACAIQLGQRKLQMEEQIQRIRAGYEIELTACAEELARMEEDLESWARLHPEAFPAGKRSLDMVHGTLGFRETPPAMRLRKGVKEEHVIELLRTNGMSGYVRTVDEIDRSSLLADREAIGAEKLAALGLRVAHDDRFYVELKNEEAPAAVAG